MAELVTCRLQQSSWHHQLLSGVYQGDAFNPIATKGHDLSSTVD
jgi:hypothetical protein